MKFVNFLKETTIPGRMGPGAAVMTSDQTGSTGWSPRAPFQFDYDIAVPSDTRTGNIIRLDFNKNPIFIALDDGTRLYLTLDQFNRIRGPKPEIGKRMTVVFQRHPMDKTKNTSQIQSILVN